MSQHAESYGVSSAVSSVLYHKGHEAFQETKNGTFIYDGDASKFHEWEFRTRLRMSGKKGDFYAQAMSSVVDGLRGDAFIVAKEVGLENLWDPGFQPDSEQPSDAELEQLDQPRRISGLDQLINRMKACVFPLTT